MSHARHVTQCLALLLTLITFQSVASADSWSGGEGRAPYPLDTNGLRLVSEEVLFEETTPTASEQKKWKSKSPYWSVTATYVIENTDSAKKLEAVLAIPDAYCETFEFCQTLGNKANTLEDLEAEVSRKKKKSKRASLDKKKIGKDNPWGIEEGDLYLLPLTLEGGERVEVTYRYKIGKSGAVDGEEYVDHFHTRSAPWKGKIERSRLTLKLQERPWGFAFNKGLGFKSFETVKGGEESTIVFERQRKEKPESASIILGSDAVVGMASCPIGVGMHVEQLYDRSGKKIDMKELERNFASVDLDGLRKCRNMVYAAQGYTFKDRSLQTFFYQYARPTPLDTIDPDFWGHIDRIDEEDRDQYEAVIFAPDEGYSTKRLKKRHNQWVKAIKALERERKKQKK